METTSSEKVLAEICSNENRLDPRELYEMLQSIARKAMLYNNRCALISGIASILSNIRGDDEEIRDFIQTQIDRKIDCGLCTRCDASSAKSDA